MEYVDGGSLDQIFKQYIRDKTWRDLDDALDYFRQILNGLLFAHSSGIFHRDVTPSNILVLKLDVVKLVDFGLARRVFAAPPGYDPQPGFAWTGAANFMSPEQAGGEDLDHLTRISGTACSSSQPVA
jgi:serine/threonine-protein kinase